VTVRRPALLALAAFLLLCFAVPSYAGKNTPTVTTFPQTNTAPASGVSGDTVLTDGLVEYIHGVGGVQSYLGAGGKDVDLVTYNTGRTLHFEFPVATAVSAAGLNTTLDAESDFYGVNYYGPYASMGVGTTAQVHGVLQFKVNGLTYQLDYQALAVYRRSADTWEISSDFLDFGLGAFDPGFAASSQAALSLERKRGQIAYGTVTMPIHFTVKLR
jgi:hypothetical protein